MAKLELPHTSGCLVCGRENPHGLHLHFDVDEESGTIETTYVPSAHHIGFEGMIHGGALATVLDLSSTVGSEAWNSRDLKSRPH